MGKIKEPMDEVDSKAYDAGVPSPRTKSGVSVKDAMLDSAGPKLTTSEQIRVGGAKTWRKK